MTDFEDMQRHLELYKELQAKLQDYRLPIWLRTPWEGRDFFPQPKRSRTK